MSHSLRFKLVIAFYAIYLLGDFLGGLFVLQNNKTAVILVVLIPTIIVLAYISLVVHTVQPAKKRLPAMQVAPVVKRKSRKV